MDTPGAVYTGLIQQEIRLLLPLSLSLPVLSELFEAMPLSALNDPLVQYHLAAEGLRNLGRGGETSNPDPVFSSTNALPVLCADGTLGEPPA